MIRLESLASCFQGLIPATLFTCSKDGIPNVAFLSHVDYVDAEHVALSFQFFNKSKANTAVNPNALVRLIDPDTGQGYRLRLRYMRSETTGPVFERMALRIEAIASYCGLKGIFRLLAADIYKVLAVEPIDEQPANPRAACARQSVAADPVFTMKAMQDIAVRIHDADSLERLLDSILEGLEEHFGFAHSMILLPASDEGVLVTIATRGYPENGAGAEVQIGEGIIGMVAEARKPIRIPGLIRQMLYGYAVHKAAQAQGLWPAERRIPLPGLANPESQLGVPLLNRGELVGVLCIESDQPYRFHEEDKAAIELLSSYLGIAIENVLLREDADLEPTRRSDAKATGPRIPHANRGRREIAYYQADECILVDGEYLIRS